jgi:predicted metal-dependent HD superfamily phosphohydrolase
MVSADEHDSLRSGWLSLQAGLDVPLDPALCAFDRLAAIHSTPDRAYHNLEHLAEMDRNIERLAPDIGDLDAVRLAVWFHDAISDTRRSDNEERNAALASDVLATLSVSRRTIEHVTAMIRATAHLTSTDPPADSDTAALLDADLAILGATSERYSRYARDIRLEYHWAPEADSRRGRAAVLKAFLARPRLFHHAVTHAEGDEGARRNLVRELESLGPGSK